MYVRTRFHPFKNCFEQCRAESTRQSDTYRSDPTRIDPTRIGHVSSRSVFVISFQCWPISIFLFSYFHSKLSLFSYFSVLHSFNSSPHTYVRTYFQFICPIINTRYHVLAIWIDHVQLTSPSSHHLYHTYVRTHALSSLYKK